MVNCKMKRSVLARFFGLSIGIILLSTASAGCGDEELLAPDGAVEDAGVDVGPDGSSGDADAQIEDARTGDGAVEDGAVGDGAVGDGAVGDGAVGDGAVGDGAVGDGAVGDGAVGDGAVGDGAVGDGAVGDGAVGDGAVGDGAVGDGAVGDGAVGDGAVGDGSVGDGAVGDGAVGDGAVGDGAVGDGAVGDGAVGDGAVGDGAVGDGSVGDGAVGDGAVGDGAVGDGAVGDGAVSDAAVGDGGADGSVDADAGVETIFFLIHTSTIALTEGGSAEVFTVRLSEAPASAVTVTIAARDPTAVSVNPLTLTFGTTNFGTPQTVTVAPVDDNDTRNESTIVDVSAPGVAPAEIEATVTDDDEQVLIVSAASLVVGEGQVVDFEVSLAFEPDGDLDVQLLSSDAAAASVSPATLTFTPANHAIPQSVGVLGAEDDDVRDESARITVSSPGLALASVDVVVDDDDSQGIAVSPVSISLIEGGSELIEIVLSAEPSAPLTVVVGSEDPAIANVSAGAVFFTVDNWDTPQFVTVFATPDANASDDVTHVFVRAPGIVDALIPVVVEDDDSQSIVVAPASISMTEGDTQLLTVALAFQPLTDVIVTVASLNTGVATTDTAALTFTPGNYSTPQTVSVKAMEDANLVADATSISFASGGLPSTSVDVDVADNDTQAILADVASIIVAEGAAESVSVRLAFAPAGDVLVTAATSDVDKVSTSVGTLTFTPANWNVPQVFDVSAFADVDTSDESETITLSSPSIADVTIAVAVLDLDALSILPTPSNVHLVEGGASSSFSVSLTHQPIADTTVTISNPDPGAYTVSETSVVFTTANWNVPIVVTVTPEDDVDTRDEASAIVLSAPGLTDRSVNIYVEDDDDQALLVSVATLSVTEEGAPETFSVRLAFAPDAATDVTLASDDPTVSVVPATLSFDAGNYDQPQLVTVLGLSDDDIVDETVVVRVQSSVAASVNVLVTKIDDDDQDLVVDPTALVVTEEAAGAILGVHLAFAPTGPTTVTLTSSDPSVALSTTVLSFTNADWAVTQNVTVSALADADTQDEAAVVTVSSAGLPSVDVSVSAIDDDTQAIIAVPDALVVTEQGAPVAFTVRLTHDPVAPATVDIASSDATIVPSQNSLAFDSSNYAVPQTVFVSAAADMNLVDEIATLTLSSAVAPDELVAVTKLDDDEQEILVDTAAVTVTEEGASASVGVSLRFEPAAPTVVSFASTDATIVTNPASITFTSATYSTPAPVTISGLADMNLVDDSSVLTASAPGAQSATVNVMKLDDDEQALVVAPTSLTVTEDGAGATFAVSLAFEPVNLTTVTLSSDEPTILLSDASIDFTALNYSTPQTITVTGGSDFNLVDEVGTVSVVSAGLTSVDVTVTKLDDDTQTLVVDPLALAVDEDGAPGVFGVRLGFEPTAPVSVSVASPDPLVVAAPVSLSFDLANYDIAQPVSVLGLSDLNLVDEIVDVVVSGAGAAPVSVQVTKLDDDEQQVLVDQAAVSMTEETDTATFNVALAFEPSGSVVVSIGSGDPTVVTSPTSITFDAGNYTGPVPVEVSGLADLNLTDDVVTLTLTSPGATPATVTVTKLDDDQQALVVGPTTLTVTEDGPAVSFDVSLAFEPIAPRSVGIVSGDPTVVAVGSASLDFTVANYNVPQPVTVTGLSDQNLVDEVVPITVSSAGLASVDVTVTKEDDDSQAILTSVSALDVDEDGAPGQFGVRLAFEPPAPVTVTVTSPDALLTVDPLSLAFDAANYDQFQTVEATALSDQNLVDEVVNVSIAAPVAPTVSVAVTKVDDDQQVIEVDPIVVTVVEEGATATFDVNLRFQPSSDAEVALVSSDPTVTVTPASLTFLPGNFSAVQQVTVTGLPDTNLIDDLVTITVSTPGAAPVAVTVTKEDDDTQILNVDPLNVSVTEETAPGTFGVSLGFEPIAPVTVAVASADSDIADVDQALLSFTTANWNVVQTVTVNGTSDADQVGGEVTTIDVTLSEPILSETVNVTVDDDDVQSIVLSPSSLNISEGDSETFTVRLAFIPLGGAETITISSSNAGIADPAPLVFAFDDTNYSTPRTVTVSTFEDDDLLDASATITAASNLATPAETLEVTVADDDTQEIVRAPATATIYEGGVGGSETQDLSVHLGWDPSATVSVAVTSLDTSAVSTAPGTLSFDSGDYLADKISVLSAVQDVDLQDETVVVTVATVGLSGRDAASETTVVTVIDEDEQIIQTSAALVNVDEEGTATFDVWLGYQPAANITVSVDSALTDAATVNPATLTFTPGNYDQHQTVTVSGTADDDLDDTSTIITLSTGLVPVPEGAPDVTVDVDVEDDDVQTIIAQSIPSDLPTSVQEGGPGTDFEVYLGYPPRGCAGEPFGGSTDDVVVVTPEDATKLALDPATLTFDCGNYDTPQTVTARGVQDITADNELLNAELAIAAEDNVSATHPIQILDDELSVLMTATFTDWDGATERTRRANLAWGLNRVVVTAHNDANEVFVFSTDRDLDNFAMGPTLANSTGVSTPVDTVDFDGTDFGFFLADTSGIRFARTSADLSSTLANTVVATRSLALGRDPVEFWPVYTGSAFGLVYRNGSGNLFFRSVSLNGTAPTERQVTSLDGSPDLTPNLHWDGAGYAVIYTSSVEVRCARLSNLGIVSTDDLLPSFPVNGPLVSSVLNPDTGRIVAVYVDNSLGLRVIEIDPATCAEVGAPRTVRGPDAYRSNPPVIVYNGDKFAVAYDYGTPTNVGVLTLDGATNPIDDVILGAGSRPSITWTGDRWILRAEGSVLMYAGAFQSDHCVNTALDADEEDIDCGGEDCPPCP
ncbi:MAG: hypothetical protein IPK13_03215 [Deltaproteobacteria bacterium]|nr:hypothetical protein [Deltaproteobacteria bacterium]